MKIVSISMIKNESDIIESFIRYNLNIFDEMLILDNGSTDDSVNIINKLQDENLPIILFRGGETFFNQNDKLTGLLKKAIWEYGADIVCPLDADEFISSDITNPRKIIENIDGDSYYHVSWKTYVATANDDINIKFIPSRITHIRDEKYEAYYKVIIPKNIVNNYDVSIAMGNHDLVFKNQHDKPTPVVIPNLILAHFPLRSTEQCMSKILVGWPTLIKKNKENNALGYHWKSLFEKIKQKGSINSDDLEYFSKNYALREFNDNIQITEKRINIDFCENLEIKYDYDYSYLRNVLDNYIYFVEELLISQNEVLELKKKNKEFERLLNENNLSRLNHDYIIIKNSQLFDSEWYLKNYNLENDIDPIAHFLITWRENMNDPARFFSTEFYLKTHKDVANAGMNPFVHYIKYGKDENRKIVPSKYNQH